MPLLITASTSSKLRGSSIVLNTRKFRNVIYSSSMSNEMSVEISASSSFNYKFSESRHCRATMYYNPSWSPRTVIATTSFCYFRIAGTGGPYVSRQELCAVSLMPSQAPKRTNDKLIHSTTSSKTRNVRWRARIHRWRLNILSRQEIFISSKLLHCPCENMRTIRAL